MQLVTGLWISLAGCLAALAGLAGMRRMRSLRRKGAMAWAMVVPEPGDASDRTLVQFSLGDGRIIEHPCPKSRTSSALRLGQKVLVWYDPADPSDVLVYGRHGLRTDVIFVAGGFGLIAVGVVIASLAS